MPPPPRAETNPSRFELSQVVVTPPLKLFHTFQTLGIVYRDAYNRKLNHKYLPKWREYKELARWASRKVEQERREAERIQFTILSEADVRSLQRPAKGNRNS